MIAGRETGKGLASSLTVKLSSSSRRASRARRVGSASAVKHFAAALDALVMTNRKQKLTDGQARLADGNLRPERDAFEVVDEDADGDGPFTRDGDFGAGVLV